MDRTSDFNQWVACHLRPPRFTGTRFASSLLHLLGASSQAKECDAEGDHESSRSDKLVGQPKRNQVR